MILMSSEKDPFGGRNAMTAVLVLSDAFEVDE